MPLARSDWMASCVSDCESRLVKFTHHGAWFSFVGCCQPFVAEAASICVGCCQPFVTEVASDFFVNYLWCMRA